MNIGDNIKKYRRANKMTQTELANKLNKSLRTIQKYEANETKPPMDVIRQISDLFFIDMNKLTNKEKYWILYDVGNSAFVLLISSESCFLTSALFF